MARHTFATGKRNPRGGQTGYICRCDQCRGHKPPAMDPQTVELFPVVVVERPAGSGAPDLFDHYQEDDA